MMSESAADSPASSGYKIGVASRLSGLPTHTLRKWEERYGVVTPLRTLSGGRLYSDAQIRYLTRLRELVDAGMEISDLARRNEAELTKLAHTLIAAPRDRASERPRPRVLVAGPHMPQFVRDHAAQLASLDVCARFHDIEDIGQANLDPLDLVVLEVGGLTSETKTVVEASIATSGASAAIILYRFGPHWARDDLRSPEIAVMRLPVQANDLQRMVLGTWYDAVSWPQIVLGSGEQARTIKPRFSHDALMRISSFSAAMRCECPNHIADLLIDITTFERYSADCELEQPADAEEHRYLRATAASARLLFEEALARLAKVEGISTGE